MNREELNELLNDEVALEQFTEWVKKLSVKKSSIISHQESLKDDIKSMSESYKIHVTYLNKIVDSLAKDTLQDENEKLLNLSALLETVM